MNEQQILTILAKVRELEGDKQALMNRNADIETERANLLVESNNNMIEFLETESKILILKENINA